MINKVFVLFSQGPEATVYRHCWNMTTDVSYTPSGCEEYDWTEICYCSDVNRPCNRVSHLLVSPWLMAIMTVSCFVTIMLRWIKLTSLNTDSAVLFARSQSHYSFTWKFIDWKKNVSEFDQEIPQSQTADKPMAPRGRATQQSRDTRMTH